MRIARICARDKRFSTCARLLQTRHSPFYQNAAGIYHLQNNLREAAFGNQSFNHKQRPETAELHKAALQHLAQHSLLNQETIKPVHLDVDVPPLLGRADLDTHFQKIGRQMCEPYLAMCRDYISAVKRANPIAIDLEELEFLPKSGWTKYQRGQAPQPVHFPTDSVITFDTEVLYNIHPYAVMATATTADSLYVWLSPWLLGESTSQKHLIPLGTHQQVVIGHYVSYDRKRVLEEYNLGKTKKWFMDTMGFHIAVNGMCNQQRPTHMKFEKLLEQAQSGTATEIEQAKRQIMALLRQEPWLAQTAGNGLGSVVKFHLGKILSKEDRDFFGELSREEVAEPAMLQRLVRYCAKDSIYTQELFTVLLPKFLKLNDHPVILGALRHMSSVFLPINDEWNTYLDTAEAYFEQVQDSINGRLQLLADEAAAYADSPEKLELALRDPWLSQLDWTVRPVRYTKARKGHPARPMKNQKLPGKPQWYRELFASKSSIDMNLSSRSRTTTLLLRLKWDDHPLQWVDQHGWCFRAPRERKSHYEALNFSLAGKQDDGSDIVLIKLPHPDGAKGRCTYPLAKYYFQFFEDNSLKSDNRLAMEAISMNIECSYWISCRQRVMNQMPVYQDNTLDMSLPEGWGMILPRMAPIGAVTRRAVEDTWLTASNAKKNRIGSELKCNIRAPPGYKIIGADVDSEELWIAGVVGDSLLEMHGGTAIGWMTLEGSKKAGTDLHSKSAQILGISRNEAKVFNYGRIYGAGKSSAARTLRQFNPSVSAREANEKAEALYSATKGKKATAKHFPLPKYWSGGTESVVYNQLELMAEQPRQRTPVLGAGISDALAATNLKANSFLTTRTNWSIQSSGVDYLHLLVAGMHYLTDVYDIDARLLLTVHDEVRYLVKKEDEYRAGLALQIANLWTRAMFCQQLGFDNLPYSVAFFSSVDFDYLLRKEVDDPCVTPTQPEPLAPGVALSMPELVKKCSSLGKADTIKQREFESQPFEPRIPAMADLNDSPHLLDYVRAQLGIPDENGKKPSTKSRRSPSRRSSPQSSSGVWRGKVQLPYVTRSQPSGGACHQRVVNPGLPID